MNSMPVEGIIFDFNGTLFDDTSLHNQAWTSFAAEYGRTLAPEDFNKHIHGHTNKEILQFLFGESFTEYSLTDLYEEKERIYRGLCESNPSQIGLTPGAEEFLEFLKSKNILRTIATASYLPNVKMYFEIFPLSRWFRFEDVVYDDGTLRGKPHPDLFLTAGARIGLSCKRCMVVEDSPAGLQAAHRAGAAAIIAVDFTGKSDELRKLPFISQIVNDFRQIKLI